MDAKTSLPMNLWYLRKINIIEQLDRSELEKVARVLFLKEIARGELVSLSPQKASLVYFLFKGEMGVSRIDPASGKEMMLYLIRPGEPFGLLTAPRGNSPSVARVLKKSLIGYMHKKDFRRLIKNAEVHTRIEKLLESRLIKVENRLEELAFCDVSTRLARLLLRLAKRFPRDCPEGVGKSISLRLTQQELGNLIAATREITNLTLNEFRRNEWVKLHGRHICLHNQSAMKQEVSKN